MVRPLRCDQERVFHRSGSVSSQPFPFPPNLRNGTCTRGARKTCRGSLDAFSPNLTCFSCLPADFFSLRAPPSLVQPPPTLIVFFCHQPFMTPFPPILFPSSPLHRCTACCWFIFCLCLRFWTFLFLVSGMPTHRLVETYFGIFLLLP